MNQDEIRNDNPPADPNFLWKGPRTDFPRDPAVADAARRAKFATARETALAAPVPENAMILSHNWGVPHTLVSRLLALEGVVASLAGGLALLEKAISALAADNHELHELVEKLSSKTRRP